MHESLAKGKRNVEDRKQGTAKTVENQRKRKNFQENAKVRAAMSDIRGVRGKLTRTNRRKLKKASRKKADNNQTSKTARKP
jgi:hypothetical protein